MEKGGGSGEGGCRGMSGRMKEDRGETEGRQRRKATGKHKHRCREL